MDNLAELKESFEKINSDPEEIKKLIGYAKQNFRIEPEKTAMLLRNILEKCREIDDEIDYALAEIWLGWYYHDLGNFDEALRYHNETLITFKRINHDNPDDLLCIYNAIMVDYMKMGMMDLAIKYGLDGWNIAIRMENNRAKTYFLVNTAMAFVEAKNYKEAEKITTLVLNMNCTLSEELNVLLKSFQAECEYSKKNYDLVIEYCNEGMELIKNQENEYMKGFFNLFLAESFLKLGQNEKAQDMYTEAWRYGKEKVDIPLSVDILVKWASFLSSQKEEKLCEEKLKKAVTICGEVTSDKFLGTVYEDISNIYSRENKYELAYKTLKKSNEYKSKLFSHSSSLWYARLKNEMAIDEGRMYKELYSELNIISHFGMDMLSDLNEEKTLKSIYKSIRKLMDVDIFGIALFDEKKDILDYKYFIENDSLASYGSVPISSEKEYGILCFKNAKEYVINDLDNEPNNDDEDEEEYNRYAKSFIYCPLITNDKVIGVITVQNYKKNSYTNVDLNKVKLLSSFIAVALGNVRLFKKVQYMAVYDGLTSIYNRKEALRLGGKVVEGNISSHKSTGILMIDIDDFKMVNDTYGHQAGDEVLRTVADIVNRSVPEKSILGRYGGEEFIGVFPDMDKEEAFTIGETIRKNILKHRFCTNEGILFTITASIGVGVVSESSMTFDMGIKEADDALYRAKHKGKNCVE